MLGSIFPDINQGALTSYIVLPTSYVLFFSLSLYASTVWGGWENGATRM